MCLCLYIYIYTLYIGIYNITALAGNWVIKSNTINDVKCNLSVINLPIASRIHCKFCWYSNVFAYSKNIDICVAFPEFLPLRRMK